jgi:hypothetical protein
MEKDILDNFLGKIDTRYFDRNTITIKLLLLVSIIFLVADGLLWYRIYINSIFVRQLPFRSYLLPLTIFIVFILLVFSWVNNLKGNQLLKTAIVTKNGSLVNKGLIKIFYANLIVLLALCSAIASAVIEITFN